MERQIYDADFYRRKVHRLQDDYAQLQTELATVRARLRKAEDFQIKYQMLYAQNLAIKGENDRLVIQIGKIEEVQQVMRVQVQSEVGSKNELLNTINFLSNEVQIWKKKFIDNEKHCRQEKDLEIAKITFQNSQLVQSLRSQVAELNSRNQQQAVHLHQQLSQVNPLQNDQKLQQQRGQKFNELLNKTRQAKDFHLRQLNELKQKFDQRIEENKKQLQRQLQQERKQLKQQFAEKMKDLKRQSQQLGRRLEEKGRQLLALSQERTSQKKLLENQIDRLLKKIRDMEFQKLQERRKSEELLYKFKDQILSGTADQLNSLKQLTGVQIQTLRNQIQQLHQEAELRLQDYNSSTERYQHMIKDLQLHVTDRNERIKELLKEMKEKQDTFGIQYNSLHESMRQIEDKKQKENKGLQHLSTVNYLQTLVKRLNLTVQGKSSQIYKLRDELFNLRRQNEQRIREYEQKLITQIKSSSQELKVQIQKNDKEKEEFLIKEKNYKNRIRELQRQLEISKDQTYSLKLTVQNIQTDYKKMNDHMKQIDQLLRLQRNKSSSTMVEMNSVRKESLAKFQKVKADLQVLKRTQIDLTKDSLLHDLQAKNQQIEKLKRQLNDRADKLSIVQNKLKKYEDSSAAGQTRVAQFQKKLSALNAEIGLTQQLYQLFLQAKGRISQKLSD